MLWVKPQPSAFETCARKQRRKILAEIETSLTRPNRKLIRLRYWHDLSFPQISLAMDRSIEAVEIMHTRVIKALHDGLADKKIHNLREIL